jgi:hypothetical protein
MLVFWVVTPCELVHWYQCFRGTYCLHLRMKMEASTYKSTHHYYPENQYWHPCYEDLSPQLIFLPFYVHAFLTLVACKYFKPYFSYQFSYFTSLAPQIQRIVIFFWVSSSLSSYLQTFFTLVAAPHNTAQNITVIIMKHTPRIGTCYCKLKYLWKHVKSMSDFFLKEERE